MMKRTFSLCLAAFLAALFSAGCSGGKPKLYLYSWADYIDPELVIQFEREKGCEVIIDTFDSNETMHAKIKAGASGYDLIVPTSYMVNIMAEEGLLEKLDHAKIPNLKHIDPNYLRTLALDPAMEHGIPYMLGSTGIGYVASKVPDFEPSWRMFENAAYAKRMTLFNDMREVLGAALKTLSFSLNTVNPDEINQARDLVIRWKANLAKFDSEQYKPGLASSEFLLSQGYSGDVLQIMEENPGIRFAIPKEGTAFSCDDLVIPKGARNLDLAYEFINFLHDPEHAARNVTFVMFWCPNSASYAHLAAELKNNPSLFPPQEVLAKCEVIKDLGEQNQLYINAWNDIKSR